MLEVMEVGMSVIEPQIEVHVCKLVERYPILQPIKTEILDTYFILDLIFSNGGKLLVAGNGGSSADADHIVGELMKGFVKSRNVTKEYADKLKAVNDTLGNELAEKLQRGLPAISLNNHSALNSAFSNDVDGDLCFAQQVQGYGESKDIFLGISTSGNSKSVLYAAVAAKAKGMKVIALSGKDGGKLKEYADNSIIVPEKETYMIQELHLPIYHCLCLMLEERFF